MRWLVLWTCAWFGTTATAAPTAAELELAVGEFNSRAVLPIPSIQGKQIEALLAGEVVRLLHASPDASGTSAAVGVMLSDVSRDALWIAAQDPHTKVDPGLTELRIASLGHDRALWYGYWDLPRPVRDRQWVVDSRNHHALAAATDDRAWEHLWELVADGLARARPHVARGEVGQVTLDDLDHAIYTPVNEGCWFMLQLHGGHTLVGYQARSVVGGAIPDWLVNRLVLARMESLLRDLETRARTWAPAHYTEGHEPVLGGGGEAIGFF